MMELNVVGWSALLVPPALVGSVAASLAGWPVVVGAPAGAALACAIAIVHDRRRWRNQIVSVSSDLDLVTLRCVLDDLHSQGIEVSLDAGDPSEADPGRGDGIEPWRLVTRQRSASRVISAVVNCRRVPGP